MTFASAVALSLALSLGQATGHGQPAAETGAHGADHGAAAPAAPRATDAEGHPAAGPAAHGGPGAEHGAAAGEHEEGLAGAMMHHVTDGYVLEYPGVCHGGFRWNCHVDLKEIFGDALVFHVGGTRLDMTPSKHLLMMWLATAVLFLVVLVAVRRRNVVPSGLYNFVETLVQFVRNEIAVRNMGEKEADRFVPYLVSAFFFILFLNLFGLIPYAATATGNLSVTLMMALFTFVITQYAQIKAQGIGGWLAHLTGGVHWLLWPIMIPVEILGLFTKPFALTIRLFANMIAGHIVILSLIGLIFALGTPWVAIGSVPMALAIFLLELFVAFVQAYIFTMLSSLFIGAGLAHHGDDGHEPHGEHGQAGPAMGSQHHGSHVAGASPGHG
jgi:F-type H+-transporting ATPase subunit a